MALRLGWLALCALARAPGGEARLELRLRAQEPVTLSVVRFSELVGAALPVGGLHAPLVAMRHKSLCGALLPADAYSGAVVFLGDIGSGHWLLGGGGCPFEVVLDTLWRAGAVGALASSERGPPGKNLFVTENLSPLGSEIPLIEAQALLALLAPLLAAVGNAAGGNAAGGNATGGYATDGNATAALSVDALDANEWRQNRSLLQPLAVTVLAAAYGALAWITYARAFRPLLAMHRAERLAQVRKVPVLYLCALCVLATSVVTLLQFSFGLYPTGALLIWGHGVLPEPPLSLQQAFEPIVLGFDSLTTLALVLHWNEMLSATVEGRPVDNVLAKRKGAIAASLVVSFVPTFVKSIPGALYINSASLAAVIGMTSLLVACSSAWMLWSLARFRADANDLIGQVPPVIEVWLFWGRLLSAFNLLLVAIIVGFLQLNVPYMPDLAILWISALYLTIGAVTFCKLNCIAPNPARLQSAGKPTTIAKQPTVRVAPDRSSSSSCWRCFACSWSGVAPAQSQAAATSATSALGS
jgi:hypothetical protein